MRKVKRKYTRREVTQPPVSNSEISQNSGIGGQSGSKIPTAFSFNDLPLSIRTSVENTIKMRKRLGLSDDSKERKERAVQYFKGDRPR